MVNVAKPWKHPETGAYYLRRQVPAELRAAFGGRQLFKVGLKTKDPRQAATLFQEANAELEARFKEARQRLHETGSPLPSSRDRATTLIQAYVNGPPAKPEGLDGPSRLQLARREIDRGLWNGARFTDGALGCSRVPASTTEEWTELANNAALFAIHRGTIEHLPGMEPGGVWHRRDFELAEGSRAAQLIRFAEQIALHAGLTTDELPPELIDELEAFLDALPATPTNSRRNFSSSGRLRPNMRLIELFDAWQAKRKPSEQTAKEFRASITDFIDFLGNIPATEITADDILNYSDMAAKLPASMPRADRLLPFMQRVAKHVPSEDRKAPPRIGPETLKKRVGAIQALLNYATKERWLTTSVGSGLSINSERQSKVRKRLNFDEDQIVTLFGHPIFLKPGAWSWRHRTSDCSLFWIFLICFTTGARIEEIGQALLGDVKRKGTIVYIDIDDYSDASADVAAQTDTGAKSLKNAFSRRLVPIHDRLIALGFVDYCDSLRHAGNIRLFPDLLPNSLGKRTQDASKRANALINRTVSKDPRLVFHSFRHGFKDFATEGGLSERVVDQICGHVPTSVGGKYGSGIRLHALHRFMHQIEWPNIGWDRMREAASTIDWGRIAARHAARITS